MTTKTALISSAVLGLLALGVTASSYAADAVPMEKCYGVSKAGKNDCAGKGHACQGQSKTSGDARDFIKVPVGTCDRLNGGTLTAAM